MRYWWNMLGHLGAAEHYFEARHQASEFASLLKRTSLRNDLLMYAVANGYV